MFDTVQPERPLVSFCRQADLGFCDDWASGDPGKVSGSIQYLDKLSQRSEALQSANVIRKEGDFLLGDMMDGLGFIAALEDHKFEIKSSRVALMGVGPADSASS